MSIQTNAKPAQRGRRGGVEITITVDGETTQATVPASTALVLAKQILTAAREQRRLAELEREGCPWYISTQAVRDYIAIRRMRDPDGERTFAIAEGELMDEAKQAVASGKEPKHLLSGALQYRGRRPHRLNLIVSERPGPAGPLPQLVQVIQPGAKR